jgi:hypothetical protein
MDTAQWEVQIVSLGLHTELATFQVRVGDFEYTVPRTLLFVCLEIGSCWGATMLTTSHSHLEVW